MLYLAIQPDLVDSFSAYLNQAGWTLVAQEAGQTHFVGWGYYKKWQKLTANGLADCKLVYEDRQGQIEAYLEFNPFAKPLLELEPYCLAKA